MCIHVKTWVVEEGHVLETLEAALRLGVSAAKLKGPLCYRISRAFYSLLLAHFASLRNCTIIGIIRVFCW